MVDTSSNTGVNKAQLVSTHDGRVIVPVYDWCTFLGQHFKKIANIKKVHHFRFSKEEPGVSCLLPRIFDIPGTSVCDAEGWCCDPTCFCSSA